VYLKQPMALASRNHRLCVRRERRHGDVTQWFGDCAFEASSSALWPSPSWLFATRSDSIGWRQVQPNANYYEYFDELQTHRSEGLRSDRQRMVATRQSPGSPALKHTLLYGLLDSKCDQNLLNKHYTVLRKS